MLPIVTIRELLDRLETVVAAGFADDTEVVLTTRENAGSYIGLGLLDDDGSIAEIPAVTFRGMVEL